MSLNMLYKQVHYI